MTPGFRRPYWKVSFKVAIVWWCVSGLAMVAAWTIAPNPLAGLSLGGVVLISLGSGLVAAMAIVPGLIVSVPNLTLPLGGSNEARGRPSMDPSPALPDPKRADPPEGRADSDSGELSQSAAVERIGQAFLAGMLIRLAGTVALFMASSYYLNPTDADSVLASIAGSPNALSVAVWVLIWHTILLLTEVVSLVGEIKL